jgi:hypothetical protein
MRNKKKRSKIVLEITLESEAFVGELTQDENDTMNLCPIEEMMMVAGQCRLPWIGKGIKKVTWKEKNEDGSYEFDVYRLQFNYSDIGQKTKIEDIDE